MPLSEEYLAGLFDGEGHVSVTRNRANAREYLTVGCGISNQARTVLEEIRDQYGGGVYCANPATDKYPRATYQWCARSTEMTAFLESVLPHLRIKKRQAELGIAFQRGMQPRGSGPRATHRVSNEEAARREALRIELRALNAKNRLV